MLRDHTHHDIFYLPPHPHSSEAQRFITILTSHKKTELLTDSPEIELVHSQLASRGERQWANNRQEHTPSSSCSARHSRNQKRFTKREIIRKPQGTLPQPLMIMYMAMWSLSPRLHKPWGEEEALHFADIVVPWVRHIGMEWNALPLYKFTWPVCYIVLRGLIRVERKLITTGLTQPLPVLALSNYLK